jgi:hypothetical protein
MKDVFQEAGISVVPKNKKEIDQAIHKLMEVKYKKCMPDCWGEVKKTLANEKSRKAFVSDLKKALTA